MLVACISPSAQEQLVLSGRHRMESVTMEVVKLRALPIAMCHCSNGKLGAYRVSQSSTRSVNYISRGILKAWVCRTLRIYPPAPAEIYYLLKHSAKGQLPQPADMNLAWCVCQGAD